MLAAAFGEPRKELEHARQARAAFAPADEVGTQLEVLEDRHLRKELSSLGHLGKAARDDRRGARRQRRAVEQHLALARDEAGERAQQRALAGAVRPDDHGELAALRLERDVLEHAHRAVARREPPHDERGAHAATLTAAPSSPR
jgi:hypothetical protein